MLSWDEWQHEVISLLNAGFEEILEQVSLADVDWSSWRRFFLEGRSPGAAISRALERDL
jgi:hypothetical protein